MENEIMHLIQKWKSLSFNQKVTHFLTGISILILIFGVNWIISNSNICFFGECNQEINSYTNLSVDINKPILEIYPKNHKMSCGDWERNFDLFLVNNSEKPLYDIDLMMDNIPVDGQASITLLKDTSKDVPEGWSYDPYQVGIVYETAIQKLIRVIEPKETLKFRIKYFCKTVGDLNFYIARYSETPSELLSK